MAVPCQTLSVLQGIPKGSIIQVVSAVDPGASQTVVSFEWILDSTTLPYSTGTITIDTSSLSTGVHTLLLNAQNSCGNVGYYSKSFIITAPTTGNVSFASTPSGADIYFDGTLQTPKTPATITNVSAGSHSYTLKLSGYNDAAGTVTVTSGQTASVSVTLTPVATTGSISFSSTPSGADIYIDSTLQTAKTPATITGVSAGSHTYRLSLTGYNDAAGTVTVTVGQTAAVSVTLTQVVTTGSISFASNPSGANIYLDGTLQTAKTPATITNISAGSHSYTLRLTGYNDATGTVTVTAGQTATVSVTLTPVVTTGSISFDSSPSGADIYIDNFLQTPKTPATITGVLAGGHAYTLRLTGYNNAAGTVTVTAGQTSTVSVTLVPATGSISFSSTPFGADIFIDNIIQTVKTPATITNISSGSYTYLLRLTGYNDAAGTVTVTSGQIASVSVTLVPVVTTGSISFTSTPQDADIYLDGSLVAMTPVIITGVSAGIHNYLLQLSGYSDATGTVTVTAGQTATVSVTLVPASYAAWIASLGGISAIAGNLAAVGNIIDGYLGMVNLGFTVTLANVGTTIDYYLGVG